MKFCHAYALREDLAMTEAHLRGIVRLLHHTAINTRQFTKFAKVDVSVCCMKCWLHAGAAFGSDDKVAQY